MMNAAPAGPKRTRGMVVVAVMISLMLMAAVAFAVRLTQQAVEAREREALTLARMERIRSALCAYHKLYNNFDNLSLTPFSTNPSYSSHIRPVGWLNDNGAPQGWLTTLGLSIDDVTDGWGRLISVRIGTNCLSPSLYVDTDGDGTQLSANACVVLISHGRTGRGGLWPRASSAGLAWVGPPPTNPFITANGSGAEWRNTLDNSGSASQPFQSAAPLPGCNSSVPRDDPDSPCHFDDIVWYFNEVTSNDATKRPLCPS